jgi:glycosyltransferase involved in cell wall biosynthesis
MKNHVIFVSSLCSNKVFEYIRRTSTGKSGQAIQKFHDLITQGLALQQENNIETLSSLPISPSSNNRRVWNLNKEQNKGVTFSYILTINMPLFKRSIDFFYTFFKILFWKILTSNSKKTVIVDALKLSPSFGVFLACKIRRINLISIVTDMPGISVADESITKRLKAKIIKSFLTKSDGYILITKQMNSVVNPRNKPYMIMEGMVDNNMKPIKNIITEKAKERILIYSGGIFERYGIKNLIDGFIKLKDLDIRLHIYGSGPMEVDMPKYMKLDSRIIYMGVVSNQILVMRQMKATLLINPRPTVEEFTQYSFPSKNMEYMVSGTPTVTTLLPGMPNEYLPYVYLLRDESVKGIHEVLFKLLKTPQAELHAFGIKAKDFVLENKNNFIQGERITHLIKGIK